MKRIIGIVLLLGMFVCLFACDSDEGKHFNEWIEKNGSSYYYNSEGKKQEGWLEYGSNWYYFQPSSGKMSKNQWIENKYYVDEQGRMLIRTTKEIGGIKYRFNNDGIGELYKKFNITFDKGLPFTYEDKDSNGKITFAWQVTNFNYECKENYATKNNDVTISLTFKPLYIDKWNYLCFYMTMIDEDGNFAKIAPITESIADEGKTSLDKIFCGGIRFNQEGGFETGQWKFRDISDGNYTLLLDGWG